MTNMKKIISISLVLVMLLGMLAACSGETPAALAAPANVSCSESGLITWDAVDGATSYIVTVAEKTYTANTNSYQVTNIDVDFCYSVVACAEGRENSLASAEGFYTAKRTPEVPTTSITVSVSGASEVRSGHTVQLSAKVSGTEDTTVWWEIVKGEEYITLDEETGAVTAKPGLTSDAVVEIAARSLADETVVGTRALTVVGRPALTQAMLDEIAEQTKLEFAGYVNIDLYEFGISNKYYMSSTTTIKAAADGEYWYAEYTDGNTGAIQRIYYKNHNGKACQVGVNFMNEEEYFPMLNDYGKEVDWKYAGLYNNFTGLRVSDFTFEEENWRYVYTGSDLTLKDRVVACANPYDFKAKDLALIIEDGSIIGVSSKSEDDYSIVQGYRAEQTMIVTMNYGDTVEVLRIGRFEHQEWHDDLTAAIANMQQLSSYKVDYVESSTSYYAGYAYSGFTEVITDTTCYFEPFNIRQDVNQNFIRVPSGNAYGYHQVREDLYNTFHADGAGGYFASRAYAGSVDQAKPTFGFASEIFTSAPVVDEETGATTYFVNENMCPVASTFYYGVGNDIQLYGIYATLGYLNGSPFTPYVTVKDGYIIESGFYFFLGEIYGIVMIEYSDFNTAELPEGVDIDFTAREVPSAWNQLTIIDDGADEGTTEDDVEIPADTFFNDFFDSADAATEIPFFGDFLGDTFGFGMTVIRVAQGENMAKDNIVLYYDVPLDDQYGITSYVEGLQQLLLAEGYTRTVYGEYQKGSIIISPVDSSLDLMIYIRRA